MEQTLHFTGHYVERGAPCVIVHSQRIEVNSELDTAMAVNQLLTQIGQIGMIEIIGDSYRLIPGNRLTHVDCKVSTITLASKLVLS